MKILYLMILFFCKTNYYYTWLIANVFVSNYYSF
jgi:hypothetical protein